MNTPHSKDRICPSKEDLSCWHDNGGDEAIARHLVDCRGCDRTVDFYKKVDETVRLVATPPSCLKDVILETCRKLEPEVLPFPLWMRFLRIAAAAAVVATVAGAIHVISSQGVNGGAPTVVRTDGLASAPSPPNLEIGMPSLNRVEGSENLVPRGGTAPFRLNDLVAVSIGGERHLAAINGGRPMISIGQIVRHVWTVDDLERAKDTFEEILPAGGVLEVKRKVGDDKYFFEALLTDGQLQELVDGLKNQGWALVAKEFPQPGEEAKVALTGRMVRYAVDLVGKSD